MKKIIALLLVAVMALGMVACGTTGANNDNSNETTEAKVEAPASALEVLENVWALYNEETEKFFAMGGYALDEEEIPVTVDGAPGVVSDNDYLVYSLLVPETEAANVTEAASLVHAMNANTFTAGAYKVSDVAAFSAAMREAIQNNQWMCGFPEKLLIADIGGVVVVAFGNGEVMGVFQGHLTTAYATANILVDEAIG